MAALLRANGVAHDVLVSKIDKLLLPSGGSGAVAMARNIAKLGPLCDRIRMELYPDAIQGGPSGDKRRGRQRRPPATDVLTCSAEKAWPAGSGKKIGLDNLRWAVLAAAGLDCDADGKRTGLKLHVQQPQRNTDEESEMNHRLEDDEDAEATA